MRDFIEVTVKGSAFPTIVAISAIAYIENTSSSSTRIVLNVNVVERNVASYIDTIYSITYLKGLIEKAQEK